ARVKDSGHLAGTFLPETEPSRVGPRHCVHSWALLVMANVRSARAIKTFFMRRMINQRVLSSKLHAETRHKSSQDRRDRRGAGAWLNGTAHLHVRRHVV